MALPIIVPASEFELQNWSLSAHDLPSKPMRPRPARTLLPPNAIRTTDEPTEREMLIMRWRRIAQLPLAGTRDVKLAYAGSPAVIDSGSPDCGVNLFATCEWLLHRRLRQDWALLCGANRAQVLTLLNRFKREAPIVRASDLAADAAAWVLFAMYWCGANHPAALFNKSLHPPTGVVRWISRFHVDAQRTQAREIQGQFAQYLGVTRDRCDVLVRRMMKRTGRVALLRALCEF
jgi:hypothetical protein